MEEEACEESEGARERTGGVDAGWIVRPTAGVGGSGEEGPGEAGEVLLKERSRGRAEDSVWPRGRVVGGRDVVPVLEWDGGREREAVGASCWL